MHHVIQVAARGEVAKAELVLLGAVEVGRVSREVLVGAVFDIAQLEIVMSTRELVRVEDDLFWCVHRTPAPAVDLVVEALDRPRVAPPAFEKDRGGGVSLLDPADDLVIEPVLEVGRVAHDPVGVRVLGLQVCDHLRVLLLPQPVERVDPAVSVRLEQMRALGRGRRPSGCYLHPLHSREGFRRRPPA